MRDDPDRAVLAADGVGLYELILLTMAMTTAYAATEPLRADVDALPGATVIEFGAPWCGYCRAAQPLLAAAFQDHPLVRHIKIEDGKGRPLGRSYRVTLWPTLVFLHDGREVARLVRPTAPDAIRAALDRIDPSPPGARER